MSLGTIIRSRRESMKLTQDQVAKKVGISKPYLSNIETGSVKNPPTDGVLVALERVLGFEAGQLLRVAHMARTPQDVREEHELLSAEVQRLRGVLKGLIGDGSKGTTVAEALSRQGGVDVNSLIASDGSHANIGAISAGIAVPVINKIAAGYPHQFTDLDYPPSGADEYIRCPDMHDPQAFAARVVGDSMEPAYHKGDFVIFAPNADVRNGDDCFIRFQADAGTTFKRFYKDSPELIRLQPLNSKYPATAYPIEKITGVWPAVFKIEKLR